MAGIWLVEIDDHYRRYIGMIHDNWGLNKLARKPSEYLKDRNYWGFLHDPVGVQPWPASVTTKLCGAPTSPTRQANSQTHRNT